MPLRTAPPLFWGKKYAAYFYCIIHTNPCKMNTFIMLTVNCKLLDRVINFKHTIMVDPMQLVVMIMKYISEVTNVKTPILLMC
jgi:hypothetical protein